MNTVPAFNPIAAMAKGMSFGEATRNLYDGVPKMPDNVLKMPDNIINFDYYAHRDMITGEVRPALNDNSRGPFITTFMGRFYPFSPRASEVNIFDIAHSLGQLVRYSGHGNRDYVVGEHSVHVYRAVKKAGGSRTDQLAALLHDAPEALSGFGDIASPVKSRVPFVSQVEARIYGAVAAYAGIAPIIPDLVHQIDRRITADEMTQNLHECQVDHEPLGITLEYWSSEKAEAEFLRVWNALTGGGA